jgi:superfamily II DNA or RNA helicase
MPRRPPWEGARFPPRKWQAEYLPLTLEAIRGRKRGVMVACTGSGKSIYQAEVVHQVLQTLKRGWVILVTVPSQDLVEQLAATLKDRCGPANVGRWYGTKKEWARCIVCCLPSLDTFREVLAERSHRVALWIGDECHKCLPYQDTIEAIGPVTRLGCTATPFRTAADEQLAGFDFLIGRYLIGDAIRDGALVPFQVLRFTGEASEIDFDGDCIAMIKAHRDGPGVVDADSIADANQFAQRLTEEGLPAAAIHSRQGKTEWS